MSFLNAADISEIKRHSQLAITDYILDTGFDHFRLLVYRMNLDGSRTLVFTSDAFTSITGQTFTAADVNDVPNEEIGVVYDAFYQAELFQYDTLETISDFIDEFFFYTFPNQMPTTSTASGGVDETLFTRLLFQLGYNTSLLQFDNEQGYTRSLIRRGYNTVLTQAQALAILDREIKRLANQPGGAAPDDSDTVYKTTFQLTTSPSGNEQSSIERESDLIP